MSTWIYEVVLNTSLAHVNFKKRHSITISIQDVRLQFEDKTKNSIMTENKKRNLGNGIGIGAALGVAFGAAYGYQSDNLKESTALALAIGVALGAILDFIIGKKKN